MRRFERFYERHLERLEKAQATEDFSVAEVRVIHELGLEPGGGSGSWLSGRIHLDPAHVCRALKKLEAFGLVHAQQSKSDRRMRDWDLTGPGREFAESIESAHRERVQLALRLMAAEDRRRLVAAMAVIEQILRRSNVPW